MIGERGPEPLSWDIATHSVLLVSSVSQSPFAFLSERFCLCIIDLSGDPGFSQACSFPILTGLPQRDAAEGPPEWPCPHGERQDTAESHPRV